MNNPPQTDKYFSQAAIKSRIDQRQKRYLYLVLHLILVLVITVFVVLDSVAVIQFLSEIHSGTAAILDNFWSGFSGPQRAAILIAAWLTLPFHYAWVVSRLSAEKILDREMRETREYELRRYELEHGRSDREALYRLSADGELFYDDEEIEYDVKPKRKLKG